MREWLIYVCDGISDLNDMIFIEIENYIYKKKWSLTLKYH